MYFAFLKVFHTCDFCNVKSPQKENNASLAQLARARDL